MLCHHVRDFLERVRLEHPDLRWHESRGLLTRVFTIASDNPSTIQQIGASISNWAKTNQLE
jgi:hypothetical protein